MAQKADMAYCNVCHERIDSAVLEDVDRDLFVEYSEVLVRLGVVD